jgi:hypothetical protein
VRAGVDNGVNVRLQGQGDMGERNAPAGDIFVSIKVEDDPFFQRNGSDVHINVSARTERCSGCPRLTAAVCCAGPWQIPVTIPQCVLGATVTIPTLKVCSTAACSRVTLASLAALAPGVVCAGRSGAEDPCWVTAGRPAALARSRREEAQHERVRESIRPRERDHSQVRGRVACGRSRVVVCSAHEEYSVRYVWYYRKITDRQRELLEEFQKEDEKKGGSEGGFKLLRETIDRIKRYVSSSSS